MKSKNRYSVLVIVLIITTLITITAYAAKDDFWLKTGQEIQKIHEDPENDKVVAFVDDKEVTKNTVQIKKAFLALQGKKPTKNELLDLITYDMILTEESKKRGLYPSREETLEYMKSLRNMQEEAIKNGATVDKTYEQWKEYLAGRGMTENEFWESEETISGYQSGLAIGKLRSSMAEELGYTPDKLLTPEQLNEFEEVFNNKINERVKQTKKEIIDESVFEQ